MDSSLDRFLDEFGVYLSSERSPVTVKLWLRVRGLDTWTLDPGSSQDERVDVGANKQTE